ncbi:MAG: D-alanyl-D-alanine carboxypeptidase [Lachnospiraceae bacterium]|jgi:D-alanyl-D-alanine carboxypeptidase|nr:D-alanyl-D-alanine carboxypeptidase [Lachnospiraceae bacterium]MCI1656061.1 D-alanyl-D-alanine carboxypeptidase [Lachnospiraceae bacterium]MCI2194543.1 D-alanyl-D-alanine carboxypeptidase [Lachnospiraceae bacterium]
MKVQINCLRKGLTAAAHLRIHGEIMWKKMTRWAAMAAAAVIAVSSMCALPAQAVTNGQTPAAASGSTAGQKKKQNIYTDEQLNRIARDTSRPTGWPAAGVDASKLYAKSAVVMDLNTGTFLYSKNRNTRRYPASITKILTAYVAVTNCKSLKETVQFSKDSVYKTEGSGIARDVGETLTLEQCLYAMMLESANECAYAIAEKVGEDMGGGYQTFIDKMNETAKALGCTGSHFTNCNGLPDVNHYTTARDMALIAAKAYSNPTVRKLVSTTSYKIPKTNKHKEALTCYNHHKMICSNRTNRYLYDAATGGKTGYTVAAWNTLVTYAEKDGKTYVCVVLKTNADRQYTETKTLLEYCFHKYHMVNIAKMESTYTPDVLKEDLSLEMNKGGETVTAASIDPAASVILPTGAGLKDCKVKLDYNGNDSAPAGTLTYTYAGRTVGTAAVKLTQTSAGSDRAASAGSKTESGSRLSSLIRQIRGAWSRVPMGARVAGIAVAAVILLLIILAVRIRTLRRRKKSAGRGRRRSGGVQKTQHRSRGSDRRKRSAERRGKRRYEDHPRW